MALARVDADLGRIVAETVAGALGAAERMKMAPRAQADTVVNSDVECWLD